MLKTVTCQNSSVKCQNISISNNSVSVRILFSSIWLIDKTRSGAITTDHSGPGRHGNERVLRIPKAPALLKPHHQILKCHIQDVRLGGSKPICRDAVGVFYDPAVSANNILVVQARFLVRILRDRSSSSSDSCHASWCTDMQWIASKFTCIALVGRVFANGPCVRGSIPGRVKLKIFFFKWYLIPPFLTLSIIRHLSRVKWSNPGERVAPSPTPQCSSYWKGSLLSSTLLTYWKACKPYHPRFNVRYLRCV